MNVTLQKETAGQTPFTLLVEIQTATIDAGTTFRMPVQVRHEGLKKLYWVECCGYDVAPTSVREPSPVK
jgi:hypothetical protein